MSSHDTKTCELCGTAFTRTEDNKANWPKRKYCSNHCAQRSWKLRTKPRTTTSRPAADRTEEHRRAINAYLAHVRQTAQAKRLKDAVRRQLAGAR